jgi:2-dehydropantoate 2-reductase
MTRVAVVGIGSIGTAVAGALQVAGVDDVVLCSHRALASPVTVSVAGAAAFELAAARTCDEAEELAPADWILLAVKTHQTASVAGWLRRAWKPGSIVVPLQNGVEHVRSVRQLLPEARVLPAVVWVASALHPPHRAEVSGGGEIVVPDDQDGLAFAALLAGSFIAVRRTDDVAREAWQKLCANAAASLEALTGRGSSTFERQDVQELARSLVAECIEVARAEGVEISPDYADDVLRFLRSLDATAEASILRDRRADRPLEWDALVGVIGRTGARHGIETPVAGAVTALLAAASG